ncbi:sugar phosphate isomerase/epimerase family protein [Fontivita pretiosa]|uniref:sugar phosphate isomerase/epimerase family protein n=1 Tax=Fontivita pretiosa TaxID=2989684 RepID=UPI003D172889
MLKLAAFADEISPQLDEQIRVCRENGIMHIELRGVYGRNCLDFDKPLRAEIKSKLEGNGMGVAAIGSPIGKVKITDDWNQHFDRFKIAVELAQYFNAPMVRLFSYYPDDSGEILRYRDEIIRRFQQKVDYVRNIDVTLVHENESRIYGETGQRCLDLMQTINSPKLRSAFDFANFVQVKQRPLDCWPMLKPYTVHIHIKDALWSDGKVVPAGKGDGSLEPILKDAYQSGYRGFLSLEPHLKAHGQFSGFSGPELFKTAADALKELCSRAGIPLQTQPA